MLSLSECTSISEKIEKEFHVTFDRGAHAKLAQRIAAAERAGLGITAEIIKIAFKIVPYWQEYSKMLEHDVPRKQALKIFDSDKTVTISEKLIEEAMKMKR